MSIGAIFRLIFGNKFHLIGNIYRSIFVDLNAVAECISDFIPKNSTIIDIGGGDGAMLNHLFFYRKDIRVHLLDLNSNIGGAVKDEFLSRIELHPSTNMKSFKIYQSINPTVVLISDVIHHVKPKDRKEFFDDLKSTISSNRVEKVIIKDIEPGYFRSGLSFLADKYISGDSTVSLVSKNNIIEFMEDAFIGKLDVEETDLFKVDTPNYALVFNIKAEQLQQ